LAIARSARTLAGLLLLACAACGGGDAGPSGPAPVAAVSITPLQVDVLVGGEAQLTAETRAADGSLLTGRIVSWLSADPLIAMVTTTGLVQGVSAGSTSVTAASEGRTATVPVTVRLTPAANIVVTPNPASVAAGASVQLTATARDGAGNVIAGKTFDWSSSNPGVAGVDPSGRVTGLAAGSATVTAAADNTSGSAVVNVTPPPPVGITQIAPGTLVEGQSATLTGFGFSTTAASNRVTVDGVVAQVTQASPTTLQITVPLFDCRPRRTAPVQVVVATQSSSPVTHPVAPASFVSLAVGQQLVLQGASDRCIQFDAATAAERYVLGVQSISEVVSTLTGVTVTGVIPGGAVTTPALPIVLPPAPAVSQPPPVDALAEARWLQHVASTAAAYERERLRLQPLLDRVGARAPGELAAAPTVPGTVQEGEQITIRFPNYSGDTCQQFSNLPVRVREISARGIFVEDVANPVPLAQSVLEQAANEFNVIYDVDVDHFGEPGDVDLNQRVVIVVTREVNRIPSSPPLAFVSSANLFPVAQCPASNEGEFFFMRAPDPTGQFTAGVYTATDLAEDFPNLLAHELAHIIQGARRRAVGGQFMVSWLAEGLATSAQEVAGFQVLGLQNGQNYGRARIYPQLGADPRTFFNHMSDLLAYFGYDFGSAPGSHRAGAPEECSWVGNTAAGGTPGPCAFATRILYGVPWSLIKNAIDRYHGGPAGQKAILRAFSDRRGSPAGGFADLQAVLGRPITTLIAEWAPVLYLDDRYPAAGFQLANWNIRDIAAAWQTPNAELMPRVRAFAGFTDAFNVRAASAGYYEISGAGRPATALRFRDAAGKVLPTFVVVWIVRVQ
jgi:hypothetical protein